MKFEGTCSICQTRCTTGHDGKWKHDKRQPDGHRPHVTGTLRQI